MNEKDTQEGNEAVEHFMEQRAVRTKEAEVPQMALLGVSLIAAERERQINMEGWTLEHDDTHKGGAMAMAAAQYAIPHGLRAGKRTFEWLWPWDQQWYKPRAGDRIRELQKAGALIAAEIDRLLRLKSDGAPSVEPQRGMQDTPLVSQTPFPSLPAVADTKEEELCELQGIWNCRADTFAEMNEPVWSGEDIAKAIRQCSKELCSRLEKKESVDANTRQEQQAKEEEKFCKTCGHTKSVHRDFDHTFNQPWGVRLEEPRAVSEPRDVQGPMERAREFAIRALGEQNPRFTWYRSQDSTFREEDVEFWTRQFLKASSVPDGPKSEAGTRVSLPKSESSESGGRNALNLQEMDSGEKET